MVAPFAKGYCHVPEQAEVITLFLGEFFSLLLVWTIKLEDECRVVSRATLQCCFDCEFSQPEQAARVLATIPDLFDVLAARFGIYRALELIAQRLLKSCAT